MNNERKNRECLECGCNVFTITKVRDLDSVLKRTGSLIWTCMDCESYESDWTHTEAKVSPIQCKTIERLEKRNKRLQRDNDRMRQFIDEYYQSKLNQ